MEKQVLNNNEKSSCSCCDLTPKYDIDSNKIKKESILEIIKLFVSLIFLVIGYFDWKEISNSTSWVIVFYYFNPSWVSLLICGYPILISAIKSLKNKKLTASNLIILAIIASVSLEIVGLSGVNISGGAHNHSYIFAAGEIAWLMGIGEMLEDITVNKCRSGIQRLVSLIPKTANLLLDNADVVTINISEIKIGDKVLIKSGETIPVDGVIVKGDATIDESSLTGEYLPIDKTINDLVFAGSINNTGVIEVAVTKLANEMAISKMAELTIEAEGKKAPVSRIADKWVGRIVLIVLVVSIIVGFISYYVLHVDLMQAIVRAATILVVFCPCALALATPTAIAAGLGNAAKNGVLIKSGAALENLSKTDTICFDKTGTITEGNLKVNNVVSLSNEKEMIKIAASVEKYSEHPISNAILSYYNCNECYDVTNVKPLQGIGIIGEVDGEEVVIMSYKKAVENKIDLKILEDSISQSLNNGNTVIIIIREGDVLGMISFSDTIKNNSSFVMSELKEMSYNTIMLTGDNEKSAQHIANICGIQNCYHSLLPEDKLVKIEDLQKDSHKVVMVGDGINDTPSLKLADCSFSMGAMGSDIAIETSDIAILNSDLSKIIDTIRLSKRVVFAIKRNIIIAMTINVVSVILSLFGLLTPVTGALVHNCTSVLVVASSALLLYNKKKKIIK